METQFHSHQSAGEMQKNLLKYLQELATETDEARKSKEMTQYLDFSSRFYRYSANNVWLIMLQKPDATFVAGYNTWQKMGRQVLRGQHGIMIFAPMLVKAKITDGEAVSRLVDFKSTFVFDISQTQGRPLPAQPNWKSLGQNDELRRRLMLFAKNKGINVDYKDLEQDVQGVSTGGRILLSPGSGVKTFSHELAHELLHRGDIVCISHIEREVEAESTSYIVCRHFGMTGLACPNYNALQGASGALILKHLNRIIKAASEIIEGIISPDEQ